MPAKGGPRIEASPLHKTNMPKDEVNASNPKRSTKTMDVRDMKAETKRPSSKATMTKEVKLVQNGNAIRQMPLKMR